MYDRETFQTAYQKAAPDKKAVVESETIPSCVATVVADKNLDVTNKKKLGRLFTLLALGATTEENILQEMQKLAIPDSRSVYALVHACINSRENDTLKPMGQAAPTPTPAQAIPTPTQAVPTPPKPPAGVRTMSDDMNKASNQEPVYSSTQSAILNERKTEPKTDVPSPSDEGRWG